MMTTSPVANASPNTLAIRVGQRAHPISAVIRPGETDRAAWRRGDHANLAPAPIVIPVAPVDAPAAVIDAGRRQPPFPVCGKRII
jgi:hypothetical protein